MHNTREKTRRKLPLGQLIVLLILCAGLVILMISRAGTVRKMDTAGSEQTPVSTAVPPVSGPEATPVPGEAATPTPEPTSTPEPTPVPEPEYFTISMVGDCTFASSPSIRGYGIAFETVVGSNYAYPFSKTVSWFAEDDLTIANLECTLTDGAYSTIEWFGFNAPTAYTNILTEGDVEFVTLANNHVMDFGETAYKDMTNALDTAGITYAGEDEWYIYETDRGLKVGIYCLYNQKMPTKAKLDAGIKALTDAGAHYTIAALHWGDEGAYRPNSVQTEMGHYAIDVGFDLVYGAHPHCLQPAEEYNGGLILYSLGNWVFGGNSNPSDYDTAIAQLTVELTGDEAVLTDYSFVPCSVSSSHSMHDGHTKYDACLNNYCATPYEEGTNSYGRVLAKLDGSYDGADINVDYSSYFNAIG